MTAAAELDDALRRLDAAALDDVDEAVALAVEQLRAVYAVARALDRVAAELGSLAYAAANRPTRGEP